MKVFAAHNDDENIRRESSAGGVFSIIATKVIEEGGVVYGAAFNDQWHVVHRRVDNISDLAMLRGSKYVFSKFAHTISEVINDLNNGRKVLFSGTPCQVAAMIQRAGQNPKLLLVEVVCHGAPEPMYWEWYLNELCSKKNKEISDILSVNFRDKRTGWKNYSFTITYKDGKSFSQQHDDNLYMRAFLKDFTLREACFRCPFKYPNGIRADITLGDFWGISHLAPDLDDDLGITIVVAKTEKGRIFLNDSITLTWYFKFDDIACCNPAIVSSPARPSKLTNFRDDINHSHKLIPILKQYAGRPLKEVLRIKIARLKQKILH